MRDPGSYHYSELYELLHNINPFRHPDKIEVIKKELQKRKTEGELPERLIPEINWKALAFWKNQK